MPTQVERARQQALAVVAGMEREPLLVAAAAVADRLAGSVRPAAKLLLDRHLDAGGFCVLLSSSPQELVERVGRLLGMHRSLGSRIAVADGRFTGGLDHPLCYGAGKVDALRLALGEVGLQQAFAYAEVVPGVVEVEGWWSPSGRCRSGIVGRSSTTIRREGPPDEERRGTGRAAGR